MRQIYVMDISLAAILAAKGVPLRAHDPVTREIHERDGKKVESAKWWFDTTDDTINNNAHTIMRVYAKARDWKEYELDPEDPIYWMKGALENRTALLHLYHNGASPIRVITNGDRTVYIGSRLSDKNKETLKKAAL